MHRGLGRCGERWKASRRARRFWTRRRSRKKTPARRLKRNSWAATNGSLAVTAQRYRKPAMWLRTNCSNAGPPELKKTVTSGGCSGSVKRIRTRAMPERPPPASGTKAGIALAGAFRQRCQAGSGSRLISSRPSAVAGAAAADATRPSQDSPTTTVRRREELIASPALSSPSPRRFRP